MSTTCSTGHEEVHGGEREAEFRLAKQTNKPCSKVLDLDVVVALSFPLAPKQQSLLGCQFLQRDVSDHELLNDGPHETQDELRVFINNVCVCVCVQER